jgi:hypothetical protein
MNLETILRRSRDLEDQAAAIVAQLDQTMRDELDHAKRGGLARLRTALVDFRHGMRQAQAQYQASGKRAA